MYEETTGEQGEREGDSSCDDEDEKNEPPPEPTRFGWIQGVMVGRVSIVFTVLAWILATSPSLQICFNYIPFLYTIITFNSNQVRFFILFFVLLVQRYAAC